MSDFAEYIGKKVVLVRNLPEPNENGEGAVEIEGTLEAANAAGVMLKPKGQVKPEIVDTAEVEEIRLAPEKAKKLKARVLKPIKLGQAKPHLLERHGATLTNVNALSEEDAFEYHQQLDHEELDLGHVHREKNAPAEGDDEPDAA